MLSHVKALRTALFGAALIFCTGSAAVADSTWQVRKSSGDVWVSTTGVQQVSLTEQATLKPGDNIRTGRNGRVLLVRGEETILIAPNSVIGVPLEKKDGLPTTIIQQAGSILLEVEERNVKHFEVETPYLAAVVKGTQFRVTVGPSGSSVDVLRGKVEVADFKSGQFALVLPGQAARVSSQGNGGLSLSGAGALNPVQQGTPRESSVTRVPVPKAGLSAPNREPNGQRVRALGDTSRAAIANQAGERKASAEPRVGGRGNAMRITSTIGDVKMDFQKATNGLARAATVLQSASNKGSEKTVWNSDSLTPGNGASKTYGQGNGNGNTPGSAQGSVQGNGNSSGNSNAGGNGNGNAFGLANAAAAQSNNGNGKGKGKN